MASLFSLRLKINPSIVIRILWDSKERICKKKWWERCRDQLQRSLIRNKDTSIAVLGRMEMNHDNGAALLTHVSTIWHQDSQLNKGRSRVSPGNRSYNRPPCEPTLSRWYIGRWIKKFNQSTVQKWTLRDSKSSWVVSPCDLVVNTVAVPFLKPSLLAAARMENKITK